MALLDQHADKWTPEPNTGCFIWLAWGDGSARNRPRVMVGGRKTTVARKVCEEAYGPPPTPKHDTAHNTPNGCVGGSCVNPDHLRWATRSENMLDVPVEKRREKARLANLNRRGARQAAIEAGLSHYLTDQPCLRGHISRRNAVDGRCLECNKERMRQRRKSSR